MKQNWEYKKIKEICNKDSSNIVLNKIQTVNGDYPLYGASGFVQNIDFCHRREPYIGIVKDGSGCGRVDIYPANSSLVGTMQYILPKDGNLLNYVSYVLKSVDYKKIINGAAIPHIYFKDYGEILVPVPPLATQSAIVSELDSLSAIIADHKSLLKKYDELEQAIFYDMFGDPVKNEKGWEVKKLGEIANVKIGPFGSLLHKQDYICNGIPLVNPIHMKNYKIVFDNDFTISKQKAMELDGYILKENDVILARRGDIGRCAIVTKNEDGFLCGTGSLFVRFNVGISSAFVMFMVRAESFSKDLISKAKGATMLNLNTTIVEKLDIPIPPLPLQQQFASKIEAIEAMKADTKKSLEKAELLFQSRMDYWFNC